MTIAVDLGRKATKQNHLGFVVRKFVLGFVTREGSIKPAQLLRLAIIMKFHM